MKPLVPFAIALGFLAVPAGFATEQLVQKIPGTYEARLSGWCKSITEANVVAATTGDYRVRRGGSLTVSGNRQRIFVEDGAEVRVTGIGSTVFVARGGRATVGGERNQIFAESGGRVVVLGKATLATVEELNVKVNPNGEECR